MTRRIAFAGLLFLSAGTAGAADCNPGDAAAREVVLGEYRVAFVTQPARIAIGNHFDVVARVCRNGEPFTGTVDIDADMPAHGHGMNYEPDVVVEAPGKVRASGLMFHMPGEWRFEFTLDSEAGREVLEVLDNVR